MTVSSGLSFRASTAALLAATGWGAASTLGEAGQPSRSLAAETAISRYGLLVLRSRYPNDPESTPTLVFKGRGVALPLGYLPAPEIAGEFRQAFAIGDIDLFVAEFETGAARCPIELRVIDVSLAGARASEPFGNCTLLKTAEVRTGRLWIEPHPWTWRHPDYQTTRPRRRTFAYAAGQLRMVYEEPGSASYLSVQSAID